MLPGLRKVAVLCRNVLIKDFLPEINLRLDGVELDLAIRAFPRQKPPKTLQPPPSISANSEHFTMEFFVHGYFDVIRRS